MTYRIGAEWRVWTRGQAAYCLGSGLERMGEKWRSQGKGSAAELIPEEFAPHSGRVGGATRLAEMGAPPWVIQREGRWASQEFMGYVRSNVEDPLWVSSVLAGRIGDPSRHPGQGTRWNVYGERKGRVRLEPGF